MRCIVGLGPLAGYADGGAVAVAGGYDIPMGPAASVRRVVEPYSYSRSYSSEGGYPCRSDLTLPEYQPSPPHPFFFSATSAALGQPTKLTIPRQRIPTLAPRHTSPTPAAPTTAHAQIIIAQIDLWQRRLQKHIHKLPL
jgi:hypothetical protein